MSRITKSLPLVALLLVLAACESRTDKANSGGVVLSISDFDGLPISASVNTIASTGFLQVGQIDVANIPAEPGGATSDLMNVEIRSYEVVYSRLDNGTRIPTPYTAGLFGSVAVGGNFTVENLPVMSDDQATTLPLSDLLFANGGTDRETGEGQIILNLRLRFFGRTLSGNPVETAPANFRVVFTP